MIASFLLMTLADTMSLRLMTTRRLNAQTASMPVNVMMSCCVVSSVFTAMTAITLLRRRETRFQVSEDVVNGLETNRQTHQTWIHTG